MAGADEPRGRRERLGPGGAGAGQRGLKSAFDASAARYDQLRRQLIPCYDDFYRTATEVIPFEASAPLRVLDLGAGTGLLAAGVLAAFPRARVTLVDLSDEMLARARQRLAAAADRVEYLTLDFALAELPAGLDAVVSALSIHHLPDAAKRALFARVYAALADGGAFVNADQVLGSTPETNRRYVETWLGRVRAAGVGAADMAQMFERTRHDRLAPLAAQLDWLREAGFADVDCYFKWHNFAVYAGRRAPGERTGWTGCPG